MKQVIFFFLIIASLLGIFFFLVSSSKTQPLTKVLNPSQSQQSAHPTPTPRPGLPVTLEIPSLGVKAAVESVGLDSQKRMDVPKNADNVGWYNLGSRPGENGNAVIDGHLDSTTGPAVFSRLKEIPVGNRVVITDDQNHTYEYIVTDKKTYPFDAVPLKEIFGSSNRPFLNLITCEGVFNSTQKNYSQRVVVYTKLVQ